MTNRHEELSDSARWFLENFDEIDLADLCASKEATIARIRDRAEVASVRADRAEAELRRVRDTNQTLVAERAQAEAERDGAYRERAHLVAWLACIYPAAVAPAPDIDEPGWQIAYLAASGWQLSWHISPRDSDLLTHLPHVAAEHPKAQWDGHTTEEKYERIRRLVAMAAPDADV
ncbi:hypothetical protein U9R90_05340 [Streptomyces sp. E11-3]|uniref:hypothetical protein n=1 Tax=Streptomyces sp. E11-3 TaxID=3110112 RepID=UPI00397F30DB